MSPKHFGITDANAILRSADGQEFGVNKRLLSISSPVFRNTFTLPQPPSPEPPSVPVVDMCETGEVIDVFLQWIYPMPRPVIKDPDLLEALASIVKKYEIWGVLGVMDWWYKAEEVWKVPAPVTTTPKCILGAEEQAQLKEEIEKEIEKEIKIAVLHPPISTPSLNVDCGESHPGSGPVDRRSFLQA